MPDLAPEVPLLRHIDRAPLPPVHTSQGWNITHLHDNGVADIVTLHDRRRRRRATP